MYSVATVENENATKFLMTERSLHTITQHRIARNRALGELNDENHIDSEIIE